VPCLWFSLTCLYRLNSRLFRKCEPDQPEQILKNPSIYLQFWRSKSQPKWVKKHFLKMKKLKAAGLHTFLVGFIWPTLGTANYEIQASGWNFNYRALPLASMKSKPPPTHCCCALMHLTFDKGASHMSNIHKRDRPMEHTCNLGSFCNSLDEFKQIPTNVSEHVAPRV
jgi:hypothetical protein